MTKSSWTWLFLVFICSLRACYLYWQSTAELRATGSGFVPWHRFHQPASPQLSPFSSENDTTIIDSTPSNLFYFTQISDLHLSKFRARGHTLHFLHFVRSILPIVNPNFVVVTGDLTDAKDIRRITSQQYKEEWDVYRQTIEQGAQYMPWYDMRGNHDCFDLPSWQSHVNFYRTHGKSADLMEAGQGIYEWQLTPSYGKYRFVAIDACPKRGPSRPFNFFGYLTSKTMDRLAQVLQPESHYNHTFVFSHYPTTTMVFGVSSKGHGFRDLAKRYSIYFCGHLHRLTAGLGEVLKWYDPNGHSLELELGDMMAHGVYRIVAVDHDLISFVDVELPRKQFALHPTIPLKPNGEILWPARIHPAPIVLITNPKDARYALPHKEPLHRIQQSQHIRFLIFSHVPPKDLEVSVMIDGEPHPVAATRSISKTTHPPHDPPLWTAPWDPSQLNQARLHTIDIRVTTPDGQVGKSSTVFRLDNRRVRIAGGPGEFIISSNMIIVLQGVTLFAIGVMLLVLVLPKFYNEEYETMRQQLSERIHRLEQEQQEYEQEPSLLSSSSSSSFMRHRLRGRGGHLLRRRRSKLRRQVYIWTLRFIEFPHDQPGCWLASVLFILALITLPWFRAEFIPSAPPNERYGTFYLWGLKFANEWVPIADTWMFAAEQVWLNVVVFVILFAWRSVDNLNSPFVVQSSLSSTSERRLQQHQKHQQWRTPSHQLHEYPWFKGLEIVYWLWRVSELMALAAFYGGASALVYNILVVWISFVGYNLAWGKGGLFQQKQRQPSSSTPGCLCDDEEQVELHHRNEDQENDKQEQQQQLQGDPASMYPFSLTITKPMDDMMMVHGSSTSNPNSSGGESSSSASSTPFNGSPRFWAKSRKRTLKRA